MSAGEAKLAVLVIRSWVEDLRPIREALAAAGLSVDLTTVDFEASLNAALTRSNYAVAIYDPRTPGLAQAAVVACLRANKRQIPLVVLDDTSALGARVLAVLNASGN